MTREEAIERYEPRYLGGEIGASQRREFSEMINQIFDDFESRTCEGCSYYSEYTY